MTLPIKTTNPANANDREDLQFSYDAALEMDDAHHVIPKEHCIGKSIGDIYVERDNLRRACEAAQRLLTSGEASDLTVVLHADEVHSVMNQLSSVLGGG